MSNVQQKQNDKVLRQMQRKLTFAESLFKINQEKNSTRLISGCLPLLSLERREIERTHGVF